LNPDLFPILSAKDVVLTSLVERSPAPDIVAVPGFSWLVVVQHGSDADAAILSHLAKFPMDPAKRGALPFDDYPQFKARGVGALAIPDAAWIALVRRGLPNAAGPNSTEAQIIAFTQQFGARTKR
jgi:hypothetical protein